MYVVSTLRRKEVKTLLLYLSRSIIRPVKETQFRRETAVYESETSYSCPPTLQLRLHNVNCNWMEQVYRIQLTRQTVRTAAYPMPILLFGGQTQQIEYHDMIIMVNLTGLYFNTNAIVAYSMMTTLSGPAARRNIQCNTINNGVRFVEKQPQRTRGRGTESCKWCTASSNDLLGNIQTWSDSIFTRFYIATRALRLAKTTSSYKLVLQDLYFQSLAWFETTQ